MISSISCSRSRATAVGRRSSNLPTAGAAAVNGKAPCSSGRPLYLAGCRLFGRLVDVWLDACRFVQRDQPRVVVVLMLPGGRGRDEGRRSEK
jgi:hypothetical protein